ncbi:MAG: hypothetical protein OEX07_13570, partial [Gammaproteobacteria bacterium]|nr:hypothetical protein [Gammaproteobacteria bacterium]
GSSALAFKEKAAFYAMQAEKYELAKKYYEEIFSNAGQIEKLNSSKMRLAYAYTLSKLNLRADAIAQFRMVLADADKLKTLASTNLRLVAFNPARQKMLANGFLSTLSESFLDKETYLKNRIAVLQGLKGGKDNHFDESSRLTFLIKDYQKLALLYETNSKPGKMIDAINKSIDLAVEWVKLSGDSVGPVIYRATINYMSLAISNPNVFKQGVNKKIAEIYRELHKGFSDYPYPTPVIHFQLAKLNILWQAMQRDVYNAGVFEGDAIAADEKVTALEKSAPDKYKELQNLVNYFKGKSNPSSTHLDR